MYVRNAAGTVVELSKARYSQSGANNGISYHVPFTDTNGAVPLGLSWQSWTVTGYISDPLTVLWKGIVGISLDNVSWRTCHVQSIDFPDNLYQLYRYELRMLVSPLLEGAVVRYPTSGYQWGLSHIDAVSQAGNVGAPIELHYLSPLVHYPLQQDIQDFSGKGLTFTRALAKIHDGVSYGINSPIFDSGLFISSETSQDTPKWTPDASTLRSIACQIKQTAYPKAWVIGAGAGTANLLSANQSNAETDTTGMSAVGCTLTRNTVTPLVGTGDFKMVATGATCLIFTPDPYIDITADQWYCAQALVKTSGCAAGRHVKIQLTWYTAAKAEISSTDGISVDAPTTATLLSVVGKAPATAGKVAVRAWIESAVAAEIMYVDSLMLESVPVSLTVWTAALNKLTISTTANTLSWTDDTTTVAATFPTADYMAGTLIDIVCVEDTSHAVIVAAHPAGGAWTHQDGTLAAIAYPELTLGNLEGSISNLTEYPYALLSTEYEAPNYSLLPLAFNTLYIANKRAEEIIKGTDGTLETLSGVDISGNLAGADILITGTAADITMSQGLAARWYLNVRRTDT